MFERNTYFDYLDAKASLESLFKDVKQFILSMEKHFGSYFESTISDLKQSKQKIPAAAHKETQTQRLNMTESIGLPLLVWAGLFFGFTAFGFSVLKFPFIKTLAPAFTVVNGIIFFGGWFIAKGILRYAAPRIYPEKNFAEFIMKTQEEIDILEESQNEIANIFRAINKQIGK